MKIGVFDSGIGGLSVARAIEKALPDHEIIFMNDQQNVPYGSKTLAEIRMFSWPIFQALVDRGCDIIVIACNTVSTLLADELRAEFPVSFIALEPMVKPAAALTKTGIIAVCATPRTLSSDRYAQLKAEFAQGIKVIEPDCSDWSFMIEHSQVDDRIISERITGALKEGADVIVLGCTHYHWIEEEIKQITAGRAVVLQPEPAIIKRLQTLIQES